MQVQVQKPVSVQTSLIKKQKATSEAQTDSLRVADVATSTPINPAKTTQTERREEKIVSARQVRLDERVVRLVIDQLQAIDREQDLFKELDNYHASKKVHLDEFKRVQIELLPLYGVKCSADRRICIMFGERRHETWCVHSGGLVVYDRAKQLWISLDSCPSQVLFAPQRQLVVGTAAGQISVLSGADVIWSSDQMHSQCVTSLRWITPKLILSTGMDGRLVVSSWQPVGMEPIKSESLSVKDLPRTMRKNNTNSTRVCAVASAMGEFRLYVATETGALLLIDPDTLSAQGIGYDPDGIEALEWAGDRFVSISATDGQLKLLDRVGHTIEYLECRASGGQYARQGNLFMALDDRNLVGYDLDLERVVLKEPSELLAFDLTSSRDLIGVDGALNLVFYELSFQA